MKTKKLIVVLSLLLALMLPLTSLASSIESLFIPQEGKQFNSELKINISEGLVPAPVKSLLDQAKLKVSTNDENKVSLSGYIKDQNIFDLLVQLDGSSQILLSAKKIFGDKVFAANLESANTFAYLNTNSVASISREGYKLNLEALKNPPKTGDKDFDEVLESILSRGEIKPIETSPEGMDKADLLYSNKITKEDILKIYNTQFIKSQFESAQNLDKSQMSYEDLIKSIEDTEMSDFIIMAYLLNDGLMVGYDYSVDEIKAKAYDPNSQKEVVKSIAMNVKYARNTSEVYNHVLNFSIKNLSDNKEIQAKLDVNVPVDTTKYDSNFKLSFGEDKNIILEGMGNLLFDGKDGKSEAKFIAAGGVYGLNGEHHFVDNVLNNTFTVGPIVKDDKGNENHLPLAKLEYNISRSDLDETLSQDLSTAKEKIDVQVLDGDKDLELKAKLQEEFMNWVQTSLIPILPEDFVKFVTGEQVQAN